MNILVGVGRAWVPGTNVGNVTGGNFSKQAMYFALNDAAATVTVGTSDPTNPRIDVVYLAIQDSQYAGTNNTAVLGIAQGVPTSGATYPANATAIPANAIALAWINVGASVSSIDNAHITGLGFTLTKHAEWTTLSNGLATATVYNCGAFTNVTASTTDPNFYTIVAGGGIQPAQPGVYTVTVTQTWSAGVGASRAFAQLSSAALGTNLYARNDWGPSEDTCTVNATVYVPPGGAIYPSVFQATGGTLNINGRVMVTKVG